MQKKLLIFETTHFETLSALLELGEGYFSEVTIFITDSAARQLQHILQPLHLSVKLNWITQDQENNRPFIKRFFRHLHQFSYTHIHIGTLEHNVLLFAWHLRKLRHLQISLTLHSINDYRSSLYTDIRNISETIAKKILYRTIQRYRVLAPAMVDRFKKEFPKKQVCFIPGNFFRMSNGTNHSTTVLSIVIPGTVEQKRRDYYSVIGFLKSHAASLMKMTPFHLTLAGSTGSSYGNEIVTAITELSVRYGFGFSYFTQVLEQSEYEKIYNQADIIWAPINLHTISLRGIAEINGLTHSPGFIIDQILFGKPAVIPKGIPVPQQLRNCNWEYNNNDDLSAIFHSIFSDRRVLPEANRQLQIACNYFKPENFTEAFKKLFNVN